MTGDGVGDITPCKQADTEGEIRMPARNVIALTVGCR
jgi:hypothetical protein